MATEVKNQDDASVTSLVSGIVQDAQDLMKQQFELFKHEMRAEAQKAKVGAQVLGIGAVIALVGSVILGAAAALGLATTMPDWPMWTSFAICGGLVLVLGCGVYAAGWFQLQSVSPVPEQSEKALKENVQWITNRK